MLNSDDNSASFAGGVTDMSSTCCYCSHGDDIFSDAISHVIYSHKHLAIRLGQRSDPENHGTSLLYIRQWDVIPNSVLSEGQSIKVNNDTEQVEICEPVYKA